MWCQGFSEPNAGSDLANLSTRAVRDGDDYVINGQKIWTSGAHYADWMILIARTDQDAPKHKGISYFLVDMKTPGITTRPLIDMMNNHGFNEVFFENVRVPRANLLGEENRGWYMATTTLDFERSSIGGAVEAKKMIEELVGYASDTKQQRPPRSTTSPASAGASAKPRSRPSSAACSRTGSSRCSRAARCRTTRRRSPSSSTPT